MRVTLIHNPGAGSQNGDEAKALLAMLKGAGHAVRYQSAAEQDWDRALEESADAVAVAGGDGTVSRVALRMAGRGVPVAPLPAGTANNITRTLGLVGRAWEELARGWPQARRVRFDVGVAEGPWGTRRFIEGAGAGLFACLLSSEDPERARVQADAPEERVEQALEILADQARTCRPLEVEATLDGKDLSGRYLLIEALNMPYVGPNLFLAPDSELGDGLLDIVLVTEAERERLCNYLASWQENRDRLAVLPTHQGKHLRLKWEGFEVHIDDKLWPENGSRPEKTSGSIDITVGEASVEFLAAPAKEQ